MKYVIVEKPMMTIAKPAIAPAKFSSSAILDRLPLCDQADRYTVACMTLVKMQV